MAGSVQIFEAATFRADIFNAGLFHGQPWDTITMTANSVTDAVTMSANSAADTITMTANSITGDVGIGPGNQ